jgi:two-component system, LuxR family, sensor kinase FixL
MQRPRLETAGPGVPLVHRMAHAHLAIGVGYLVGYVLLDWVSYVHPFAAFGITPWNPQTGLSFALVLLFGGAYLPWLVAAPFAADLIVRNLPLPATAEVLFVLTTGLGYGFAALALRSPRIRFDATLSSRGSLLWLMGAATASIALVSVVHALILLAYGLIPAADGAQVSLRAFIGDLIGVMVFTPFLLIAFTRRRLRLPSGEAVAIMVLILIALWGLFALDESLRFQLFYVFFLPVVWIAVRFGLEGVTLGLAIIQIGLIAATQF